MESLLALAIIIVGIYFLVYTWKKIENGYLVTCLAILYFSIFSMSIPNNPVGIVLFLIDIIFLFPLALLIGKEKKTIHLIFENSSIVEVIMRDINFKATVSIIIIVSSALIFGFVSTAIGMMEDYSSDKIEIDVAKILNVEVDEYNRKEMREKINEKIKNIDENSEEYWKLYEARQEQKNQEYNAMVVALPLIITLSLSMITIYNSMVGISKIKYNYFSFIEKEDV